MRKITIVLLLAAMLFLLSGCGKENADITVLNCVLPENSYGELVNAPVTQLYETLEQWRKEHPDLTVEGKTAYVSGEAATRARLGAKHLPDVFITDCLTGRWLAEAGVVLDLTDYVETPAEPFCYGESVWAFPVMDMEVALLVCDSDVWKTEKGRNKPFENWDQAGAAFDAGNDKDGLIGLGNQNGKAAVSALLSTLMADTEGEAWLRHMLDGDRCCSFTDDYFIGKLRLLQALLGSGIFYGQDETAQEVTAAFVAEECPAMIVNGKELYRLLDCVQNTNPALYDRLAFYPLPGSNNQLPSGFGYGIFLNAQLEADPVKQKLCLDLCRQISSHKTERPSDPTIERLESCVGDADTCSAWNQLFSSTFWSGAYSACFKQLGSAEDELAVEEYAALLQNQYEKNYLSIKDYSKQLDQLLTY